MNNKSLVASLVVVAAVVVVVGLLAFQFYSKPTTPAPEVLGDYSGITNYRDCVDEGYPVTQSLPRQCKTPDGRIFVEGVDNPTEAKATGGCIIGGCSGEVCSDQPGVVTDCMYESKFICYKTAVCERQTSGSCGWRQSPEVVSCLANALQSK